MENDILKYFNLLRYEAGICFHVGAHKFEEIDAYGILNFKRVLWFDALANFLPPELPQGHSFHNCLIGEEDGEFDFYIYENASGFSSKYQLKKKWLMYGKKNLQQIELVQQKKLESFQSITDLPLAPATLSVATQGSEYGVLLSADLKKIDQIMVRVSRDHLYETKSGNSTAIKNFLLSNGFYLNLNLTDLIFGHGYQYYSKKNTHFYFFASYTFQVRQLLHFIRSLTNRAFHRFTLLIHKNPK